METEKHRIPQHPLWKSTLRHTLPGVLVNIAFIALELLFYSSGYPPLLAFLLAVLFVDMPVMLGIMLFEGKRLNGRFVLDGVILYRDKLPWKTFALVFAGAFVVVFLLTSAVTPVSDYLTEHLFSGLPAWVFLEEQTQYEAYAKGVLVAVFAFQLVLTGVAWPWIEELYFRGYLLPRISHYGA